MQIVFKINDNFGEEYTVTVSRGETLQDAALKAGVAINTPCGGKGICGKCRVKVLQEGVSVAANVKSELSRHITAREFDEGWRLACISFIEGDLKVLVPDTTTFINQINLVEINRIEKIQKVNSGIELIRVKLLPPTIDNPIADLERLQQELEHMHLQKYPLIEKQYGPEYSRLMVEQKIGLYALQKLPVILRQVNFSVDCVVRQTLLPEPGTGFTILDVFPHDNDEAPVMAGLAIDIGTTTVSALLVNLSNGEILASGSTINGQIQYGADVISRIIESGMVSKDTNLHKLELLRHAITDKCLIPLISSLCETAAVPIKQIYKATIAANTTMVHLFLGVDPAYLRLEPYTPAFFNSGSFRSIDLGLPLHPDAELKIAPAAGSYVGGDISAGVFASGLYNKKEISLLVDLGTNGELVLGNDEFLMCCACSAGPAFEGGDISCGMRATTGAIEACVIDKDTMEPQLKVIGSQNQKPLGICGSGLIEIVGELFRCGIINPRGKFIKDEQRIYHDEWGGTAYIISAKNESTNGRVISINEQDIDNFIRAKGAIFSAIQTMLAILDINLNTIKNVYVAGGIGGGINIQQAIRIGLFPNLPPETFHFIGNSSLNGAYSMLVSLDAAEMIKKIGRDMTYIELSSHPKYMEELVAACFLPHTNGTLFENNE
jgi:uncharacterized 2Fe-2S/4Fe-4S cluster protein (DUF4445 family)